MKLSDQVNALTNALYAGNRFHGELGSLALLFSDSYWDGIANRLRAHLGAGSLGRSGRSSKRTVDIGIGWIDKGPYAEFDPPQGSITQRVEIADATLVFVHKRSAGRNRWDLKARCVVLQAKVGTDDPPLVPIAKPTSSPNDSTAKELTLLSNWPTFNLWKSSRSKLGKPRVSKLSVAGGNVPGPAQGWFIGADPDWEQRNRDFWMCGPAVSGAPCSLSFGQLFDLFLFKQSVSIPGLGMSMEVGADFAYDQQHVIDLRAGKPARGNDWTELCHQLLALIPERSIPSDAARAIAGAPYGDGSNGIRLQSFPGLPLLSGLLPGLRNAKLNLLLGRRPVVLIYQQEPVE